MFSQPFHTYPIKLALTALCHDMVFDAVFFNKEKLVVLIKLLKGNAFSRCAVTKNIEFTLHLHAKDLQTKYYILKEDQRAQVYHTNQVVTIITDLKQIKNFESMQVLHLLPPGAVAMQTETYAPRP